MWCQRTQDVIDQLVSLGFENVRCVQDGSDWIVTVENSAYKVQSQGANKAVNCLLSAGLSRQGSCRLILTHQNVPQLTLTLPQGTTLPEECQVRYGVDDSWSKVKGQSKENTSLFKVDLRVYPQLYLKNYFFNGRVYDSMFELSPALEAQLWPGAKFTAQVVFPLWAQGYDGYVTTIRPGYLTLEQKFLLPFNIQGAATVGNFDNQCYGGDLDLMYPFRNQHWTLNGRVGVVGIGNFYGFKNFYYNGETHVYWSVGPDYYWRKYNTQFRLRAEQYLLNEIGVKFEAIRHFRYLSVGFYAEKCNKADFNGGFKFIAVLPSFRQKRHGYWPRVDMAQSAGLNFNMGGMEVSYYYRHPYVTADDNIQKRNQFNPFFVQSGLNEIKK